MKKKFLLFSLLICISASKAQYVIHKDSIPVYGKLHFSLFDSARIINQTPWGTIYALPLDNMPVFRPDISFTSNMPVVKPNTPFVSKMPVVVPGKPTFFVPKRRNSNPLIKPNPKETLRFDSPVGPRGINIL